MAQEKENIVDFLSQKEVWGTGIAVGVLGTGTLVLGMYLNGELRIVPITKELVKKLQLTPNEQLAKAIEKQDKEATKLIASGKMWDAGWVKEHLRFEGKNLGNVPEILSAEFMRDMQYPTGRERWANVFTNPRNGKNPVFTYHIAEGRTVPRSSGANVVLQAGGGYSGTRIHEVTHSGQTWVLDIPNLNSREASVYHAFQVEAHAAVADVFEGFLEGKNPKGTGIDRMPGLLKKVDPQMTWGEFVVLRTKDPAKFNKYIKEMKQISFINHVEYRAVTGGYKHQFCMTNGTGNLEGLKIVCRYQAKRLGVDFDVVWPVIEGYATGKVEIPNFEHCFTKQGQMNALYNDAYYRLDSSKAIDAYYDFWDKHDIEMVDGKYDTSSLSKADLAKSEALLKQKLEAQRIHIERSAVLQEMVKKYGLDYVNENYEDFFSSMGTVSVERVRASDGRVLRKVRDVGSIYYEDFYFDENGHLTNAQRIDKKTGAVSSRLAYSRDEMGNVWEYEYDVTGKLKKAQPERCYFDPEVRYRYHVVKDTINTEKVASQIWVGRNYNASLEGADAKTRNEFLKRQTQEPHAPQRPVSARRQMLLGVGQLAAHVGFMYAGSWAGSRTLDWDEAQQSAGGNLMGIETNTPLALQRADQLLQLGGLGVMGAGAVVTVGTALGKKGLKTAGGQIAAKTVPVLGTVLGAGYAARRAWEGDWTGAGMEATSALMDIVTAVGVVSGPLGEYGLMGASVAMDTAIAYRDARRKEGLCDFAMVDEYGKEYRVRNADGKIESVLGARINYRHNKKDGAAMWFGRHDDGSTYVSVVGNFKNDVPDGEWIVFDSNGATIGEDGKWRGKKLEEAHYKNGKLVDQYRRVDENGKLIAEGNFTNGKYVEYWTDGNGLATDIVRRAGYFKNGKQIGVWESYDRNGVPLMKADIANKQITEVVRDQSGAPVLDAAGNLQVKTRAMSKNEQELVTSAQNRDIAGAGRATGHGNAMRYMFVTYTDSWGKKHHGYFDMDKRVLYEENKDGSLGKSLGYVDMVTGKNFGGYKIDKYISQVIPGKQREKDVGVKQPQKPLPTATPPQPAPTKPPRAEHEEGRVKPSKPSRPGNGRPEPTKPVDTKPQPTPAPKPPKSQPAPTKPVDTKPQPTPAPKPPKPQPAPSKPVDVKPQPVPAPKPPKPQPAPTKPVDTKPQPTPAPKPPKPQPAPSQSAPKPQPTPSKPVDTKTEPSQPSGRPYPVPPPQGKTTEVHESPVRVVDQQGKVYEVQNGRTNQVGHIDRNGVYHGKDLSGRVYGNAEYDPSWKGPAYPHGIAVGHQGEVYAGLSNGQNAQGVGTYTSEGAGAGIASVTVNNNKPQKTSEKPKPSKPVETKPADMKPEPTPPKPIPTSTKPVDTKPLPTPAPKPPKPAPAPTPTKPAPQPSQTPTKPAETKPSKTNEPPRKRHEDGKSKPPKSTHPGNGRPGKKPPKQEPSKPANTKPADTKAQPTQSATSKPAEKPKASSKTTGNGRKGHSSVGKAAKELAKKTTIGQAVSTGKQIFDAAKRGSKVLKKRQFGNGKGIDDKISKSQQTENAKIMSNSKQRD